jgi:hypothetical protein
VSRRLCLVVSRLALQLKTTFRFQTNFPYRVDKGINLFIDRIEAWLNSVMN